MDEKDNNRAKLRVRAEKQLEKRIVKLRKQSPGDYEKMLHELSVYQIELEMQNEELRSAQVELEESRNKYADLFDFAPMGYFILDKKGNIMKANLTGASMAGIERSFLHNKPFDLCIGNEDRDNFYKIRQEVFYNGVCRRCELKMLRKNGSEFFAEFLIDPVKDSSDRVIFCRIAAADISLRKEAEQKLTVYRNQLRHLSSELPLSEERIRRQVALDVHDDIAQNLAIIKLKLDLLTTKLFGSSHITAMNQISELLAMTIENIRLLTFELSLPVFYELGFIPAVRWLAENMQERYGLFTEFNDDCLPKPLTKDMQVLLFHAIRELLVNVVKHAQARHLTVTMEQLNSHIRIEIRDDGKGFEPSETCFCDGQPRGLGLFSIRESLGYAGGTFEIESASGKGTTAILGAPLENVNTEKIK